MMQIPTTRSFNMSKTRAVWLAVVGLVASVVLAVGYHYRHFLLSGFDLAAEDTGRRMTALLCLALVLLALAWMFVWMLFPIFVYFGMKDLRRRTAELDRTTK